MASNQAKLPRLPANALVARDLRKRCPICGRSKVFVTYFPMKPACTSCGYTFEREDGYWVGAMIVNIAVAEAWFAGTSSIGNGTPPGPGDTLA